MGLGTPFRGRKDSFIHGNTASESEFDQDNGLRYRKKQKEAHCIFFTGARDFYRSHYRPTLKLHVNPCANVKSKTMDSIVVRTKCGNSGLNPFIERTDIQKYYSTYSDKVGVS